MARPGRPTLHKPEYNEFARQFCLLGTTNEDLAAIFGVAPRTIDNWIAEIPEFGESVRQGRDFADAAVVHKLFGRAMGYKLKAEKVFLHRGQPVVVPHTVEYPPDTQACMFWLRNRRRAQWLEKAHQPVDDGPTLAELEAADERVRQAEAEAASGGASGGDGDGE
jgi:hypothetical protein